MIIKSGEVRVVSLNRITMPILSDMAKLYCEIWKESPWNEDFWTPVDVMCDAIREIHRPNGRIFIAKYIRPIFNRERYDFEIRNIEQPSEGERTHVAGFTWGYSIDKEDLRQISGGNLLDGIFNDRESVYYIDELGVDSKFRKSGIGRRLSTLLLEQSFLMGFRRILLRTNKEAEEAIRLYKSLGFKDLAIEDEKYPNRTYWLLEM